MLCPCFVLQYNASFLVLQSHRKRERERAKERERERERWLLYFCFVLNVMSLLTFSDTMGWSDSSM